MEILAESLEGVLEELDGIVQRNRGAGSRMGYFPALYRQVTAEVRRRSEGAYFDDGPRMRRLTVRFANRYLEAYQRFEQGLPVAEAWRVAFEACERWRPIVLQHLLLGMNAHINLDLGIAAAETLTPAELEALRGDFDRINDVLALMVDGVQDCLAHIWPTLRVLDMIGHRVDETFMNFNLRKARRCAWEVAEELVRLEPEGQAERIRRLDAWVAGLGRRVLHPGPLLSAVNLGVRLGERQSVRGVIDRLTEPIPPGRR